MIAIHEINRREFFKTTSTTAGLIPFLGRLGDALEAGSSGKGEHKSREMAAKALAEMEAKGGNYLSVARKDGQFLHLLVRACRAQNVLEIGTSHGYATIWISLGLEESGGKMTTIEILSERVELAKKHVGQAGLSHRVTFKEGDAHEIVTALDGPFDFVFLDADKDGQLDYFKKLYPKKIAPGAVIAAHNAITKRNAMKDYLEMISQHPDFDSVILSLTMDDGFSVSYRRRT